MHAENPEGFEPYNPCYRDEATRLETFKNWQGDPSAKVEDLAKAGFYYIGNRDQVLCYHCNGGLEHWEADDDPFVEHAKWFPGCQFVSIVKGRDFIENVQGDRNPVPAQFKIQEKIAISEGDKVEDMDELLIQNLKMKADKLCKICKSKEMEVVFIPCAHYVACNQCHQGLQTCPICQSKIVQAIRAYPV